MSDEKKNESLTRESVKDKLAGSSRYMAILIAMTDPALDWLVAHPDELEKVLSNSSEYKSYYLPDELADIVKRPDLKISNKGKQEEEKKEKKSSKSKSKFRVPDFSKVGALENDPFLTNEGEDESTRAQGLRERLHSYFQEIQDYVKKAQNPDLRTSYNDGSEYFEKIGANLGYYRKAREELKEELVQMNSGRSSNAPRFGTYWENRDDFLSGNLNPRDFWKLPKEQAEAINKEAEEYYQSIKGDKELDPDLLGDKFRFSESFHRPIDLFGKYDVDQEFSPIFDGVPLTLGGLAHFAQSQGYLNNLDDPFFTKLVAQQYSTEDVVARDYIGQLSSLDSSDLMFLSGPRGFEDEENYFKRLKVTHDPNYSKDLRHNPNRVGAIPDFNSKNPIFSRIFGKKKITEDQKRAAHAIFSLMIDAPGASKDFILGRAQSFLPNIDAKNFGGVYNKIRDYLSAKGVVSGDTFRGGAGKNVVDANLRAQEMQGWSDAEKLEEYYRLVGQGLVSGDVIRNAQTNEQMIAEVDRRIGATLNETEEAIGRGAEDFSFSNDAFTYVDPSQVGQANNNSNSNSGPDGSDFDPNPNPNPNPIPDSDSDPQNPVPNPSQNGSNSDPKPNPSDPKPKPNNPNPPNPPIPVWRQLADAFFKKRKIGSARQRKATEALFQQMVQNPGASKSYIIEKARELEPTISKGLFDAPYYDVREDLSKIGFITPEMDDLAGQKIVDANLRAQEMQGWSDDEKIAEYDRLVNAGKIDRLSDYELEKRFPKGTYRAEKKRLKNEKKSLDSEIKLFDRILSGKGSDKDFDKLLSQNPGLADEVLNLPKGKSDEPIKRLKQEAEEKLKEIVSELEEVRKGYREWAEGSLKPKLFTDRINETLQETGKAIDKNGAGNANGTFSPEVEEVVKSSGSTESFFSKRRQETDDDKKKRNREKIVDDAVLDVLPDDAKDSYRQFTKTRQKKDSTRSVNWTYKGAQTGEVFGRVLGFGSTKAATTFAKFGASIGSAAAGVAAFLGPIMVAAGVVAGLVAVFKKLKNAAEGAAKKMMEYGQYDSNLFMANMMHQGREFQRNVKFAQGTSETGTELIGAMDDFKDEALPIMIEVQNLLNTWGKGFFGFMGEFASFLKNSLNVLDGIKGMMGKIPIPEPVKKAFGWVKEGWKAVSNPIALAYKAAKPLMAAGAAYFDKKGAPKRAAEADSFGRAGEGQQSEPAAEEEKQRQEQEKKKRESALDVKKGDYTAYDRSTMSQEAQDAAEAFDLSGDVIKNKHDAEALAEAMGVKLEDVQHNANFQKKLERYQMAGRNLDLGINLSEEELIQRNAGKANGVLMSAAGFVDGEAMTQKAQFDSRAIAIDQGKSVWENSELIRQRGELAEKYYTTGEVSDEDFEKYVNSAGNEQWKAAYDENRVDAKRSFMRNMDEMRSRYESDIFKNMASQDASERSSFDFKTLNVSEDLIKTGSKDQLSEVLVTTMRNTEAAIQTIKEITAETMGYAKETAENTKPEDEKDAFQDPVFKILSQFVEQNRTVSAPQAYVDAQKNESQYGRFAGRHEQTNWGLKK